MTDSWNPTSWKEPSLDELFAEPMIQQLMQRDGVHAREMQHQLYRAGRYTNAQRIF